MSDSEGRNKYRLQYEISPIILTGASAVNLPGAQTPIISFTQPNDFPTGILDNATAGFDFDTAFAHFMPSPGSTLIDNEVGMYPFANQTVAANAIIAQPLRISMIMICPARKAGGYQNKTSIFESLQTTLTRHNLTGGTYTVSTPTHTYQNCIMTGFRDVSSAGDRQKQSTYQMDFVQPLLTSKQAEAAQNSLMQRMTDQTAITANPPSYTGLQPAVGLPSSGAGPSVVPAASGLRGSFVGAFQSSIAPISAIGVSLPTDLSSAVSIPALSSLSASSLSARVAQAASLVIGNAPATATALAAGNASAAAQAAVRGLSGGSRLIAATTSLNRARAVVDAAKFSVQSTFGVLSGDAPLAATGALAAAQNAYQAAQQFLGSVS
jgi:hypothetical protein